MATFPVGVSGCYNDSHCLDGACTVTYDKGKHYWCDCKDYYNPLDNCTTNYFDSLNPVISWSYLILSCILDIVCISILATRMYYEINKWWRYRSITIVPRSKFVTMSINVLCCIVDIVAAGLFTAGLGKANVVTGRISSVLFTLCLICTIYYLLVMLLRSDRLENPRGIWKVLTLSVIVIGCFGLFISYFCGVLKDFMSATAATRAMLTLVGSIILSLTLIIVFTISIPLIILILRKFSRNNETKIRSIIILELCSRIVISTAVYAVLCLIILIALSYFFPPQLFTAITIYKFTSQILYGIGRYFYAAFFLVMKIPKKELRGHKLDSEKVDSSIKTINVASDTTTTLTLSTTIMTSTKE